MGIFEIKKEIKGIEIITVILERENELEERPGIGSI